MQVGEAWRDEEGGAVFSISLSPDGKKVASGSEDDGVRLWDMDTGKVVKKFTGHTDGVKSVCWSPDGGRVVSGSDDETFRVWDVESSDTMTVLILAPKMRKEKDDFIWAVCDYSPDEDMIATGGDNYGLKIWDSNTGELLKTLDRHGGAWCLTWTSDALIAGGYSINRIRKFDVPTWTEIAVLEHKPIQNKFNRVNGITLSPNERILASVSENKTAQLWDFANNQPIGPPLHHEGRVRCAAFSADGKLLVTGCWLPGTGLRKSCIYTWDVSAILREAGLEDLLSDNDNTVKKPLLDADATQRRRPPIKDARQIPRGFFDDSRDFDTSHRVASQGRRDRQPLSAAQFLIGRLTSLWRRHDSHGETERDSISRPHPLSWAQDFVSGMLHRRHVTDIELRETPVVEVPCTKGKPRNYHARKKPSASSSRPPNPHTTQQSSVPIQNTPSSSQGTPAITTASEALPGVATTALATEMTPRRNITVIQAGCWIRFLLWVGCASIEYTNDQH
ncbi:WD40-repeat-containing domain protein [Suillus fuscotomentosus]|uniref:WD40-repeat-containing domain protein n=1 Tax=Suillus fuscotomentosus TaxID=1912939 RepID=A0AAD4DUE0_9AGAM|nr:WD40-repeat-containing domain protein [Suillus fuscotomentosus]KAG1893947.1 WD40-repeat-containing domain protein [Suillus fuscotomentosus]